MMQALTNTPEALVANEHRLIEATRLAWRWHGLETRKAKPISYMSHLLQVEGLVISVGGDVEQAIAALLHDSLEDAPTPAERTEREARIESDFGAAPKIEMPIVHQLISTVSIKTSISEEWNAVTSEGQTHRLIHFSHRSKGEGPAGCIMSFRT